MAALPVMKLGTLLLRTLSKPIANRLKSQAAVHPKFRDFIISIAQCCCGLTTHWWQDVSPNMSPQALSEFIQLVDRTQHIQLMDGIEDKLVWAWETNGCYSARSAYRAFFAGRVEADGAAQIWRSRAPAACKFFAWLAARERCWTADRLARRHLPHPPACPFCDQAPKTINHILLGCVFARQVWLSILDHWDKLTWLPSAEASLVEWWTSINPQPKLRRRHGP